MVQSADSDASHLEPDGERRPVTIVAIGASAGGLAALEEFFKALPADAAAGDIGFVVVQHLDPDHESLLLELVTNYTGLEVVWAEDGMPVLPGRAYLMPRDTQMELAGGLLRLQTPEAPRGRRLPIDHFFASLATDAAERAVVVILSGTGTDGTLGAREIKQAGGVVIAQLPASAGYDGMPRSVISAGLADYVLEPRDMPEQIFHYAGYAARLVDEPGIAPETKDALSRVVVAMRDRTGHDFSHYKPNTIRRRVERRMSLIRVGSMGDYVTVLERDPAELDTLFHELLIGVTSFFRDKEAFASLEERVIRPLVESKSSGDPIRVWVPGCSTGEEAYSIAILLNEAVAETKRRIPVQVFATDIDVRAIDRARAGVYRSGIIAEVSPERLDRYFVALGDGYRISEPVRDTLVFATQDVTSDPPFSRLDLISCRNLLIYMDGTLQKRLNSLFHYALNPDGYLFLGSSETIGDAHGAFDAIDRKWKIYRSSRDRTGRPTHMPLTPLLHDGSRVTPVESAEGVAPRRRDRLRDATERAVLDRYSPPAVTINTEGDVLFIHGRTGRYLEPASGEATTNLLKMAREGVRLEIATGVRKVLATGEIVRYDNLKVRSNGTVSTVNLIIEPLQGPDDAKGAMLVLFEETSSEHVTQAPEAPVAPDNAQQRIADLDRELSEKEEFLRATVEELETANEELKSTNEELQSSNEELQSTIEELETSKEELQSVNEELVTVNSEHQQKIDQLSQANNDMNNLLAGTGIGTLFVDHQLRIQRFTPAVTDIINLIQSDVGRPFGDIALKLKDNPDLLGLTRQVLATLVSAELEVEVEDGRAFVVRIQPYRTLQNVIEGAVISFVDMSTQRDMRLELQRLARVAEESREYAQNVVDSVRDPLLVLDGSLTVVSANTAFYSAFARGLDEREPNGIVGKPLTAIGGGPWADPSVAELLTKVLPTAGEIDDISVSYESPEGTHTVKLSARELVQREDPQRRLILLTAKESESH